jgi:predicted RNA-binding Zn ribbon-like protein
VTNRELAEFNAFLVPVRTALRRGGDGSFVLEALDKNLPASAKVARSFAELLAQDARRLKVCGNSACRWMFFDESRNRIRRWCDARACGNVMKARRYRARQRKRTQEVHDRRDAR